MNDLKKIITEDHLPKFSEPLYTADYGLAVIVGSEISLTTIFEDRYLVPLLEMKDSNFIDITLKALLLAGKYADNISKNFDLNMLKEIFVANDLVLRNVITNKRDFFFADESVDKIYINSAVLDNYILCTAEPEYVGAMPIKDDKRGVVISNPSAIYVIKL